MGKLHFSSVNGRMLLLKVSAVSAGAESIIWAQWAKPLQWKILTKHDFGKAHLLPGTYLEAEDQSFPLRLTPWWWLGGRLCMESFLCAGTWPVSLLILTALTETVTALSTLLGQWGTNDWVLRYRLVPAARKHMVRPQAPAWLFLCWSCHDWQQSDPEPTASLIVSSL